MILIIITIKNDLYLKPSTTKKVDATDDKNSSIPNNSMTSQESNPEYILLKLQQTYKTLFKFDNWCSEINAEKFKAGIVLKLLPQKFKAAKLSYVSSIIIAEVDVIILKTETLIMQETKNVYLTMTFPNKENLNAALSIDISIDFPELGNSKNQPLRLQQINISLKKSCVKLQDETIKIWDLPYITNYGTLSYCNTRPTGNYLNVFIQFSNPSTVNEILAQGHILIGMK